MLQILFDRGKSFISNFFIMYNQNQTLHNLKKISLNHVSNESDSDFFFRSYHKTWYLLVQFQP